MSNIQAAPGSLTRDASIDGIRGLLLLLMALNHVPSDLRWLSDHPLGYVSSAEGFVFLSGVVAAKVYTRRARAGAPGDLQKAALARTLLLYRSHLLTAFAVFSWVWLCRLTVGSVPTNTPELFATRPLEALVATVALLYQPGLLDILPMYCGMMLLLPWALAQFERGAGAKLLAASFLWWGLTNLLDSPTPYVNGVIVTGAFNFGAWQLVFALGAWVGHASARAVSLSPRSPALLATLLAVSLLLLGLRHGLFSTGDAAAFAALTNKTNLAPIRLLNMLCLFQLFGFAMRRWPPLFRWSPVARIGRNSLPAFCVQSVASTMVLSFPAFFELTAIGRWVSPALVVVSMFAAAWISERRATAQREAFGVAAARLRAPCTSRADEASELGTPPSMRSRSTRGLAGSALSVGEGTSGGP